MALRKKVRVRHILLDNREAADAFVADLENGPILPPLRNAERPSGPSG